MAFVSVLLRMGFTCALRVTEQAVVSYTAFPPLRMQWGRHPAFTPAVLGMETFLVHGIRRISAPCLGVFHASAYLPIPFAFCLRRCFSHVHISAYADPPTMCRMPASLHTRYISVALSLESPPPDVIRHPALWSPDFPRSCPFVCMTATTCCPLISN